MTELARLMILVCLAGAGVTFLASAAIWFADDERRIRRALRHVLGAAPDAQVTARGRGRGAGFAFATGKAAVAWEGGRWCLVYGLHELMGAELVVDGEVAGRVFRGEPRRALDRLGGAGREVTLRLIFDDPNEPDFDLPLWRPGDQVDRQPVPPGEALAEANRWLARVEAVLRRPAPPRPTAPRPASEREPPAQADAERDNLTV